VFGARPSAVATLGDRATRYTMVVALPHGYKADTVAAAVVEHMAMLPTEVRRSLTWDRGREMASHAVITAALSMPVFFCDPHHPWQLLCRGTSLTVLVRTSLTLAAPTGWYAGALVAAGGVDGEPAQ